MLNMVIGQNIEVTPLQVAQLINLVANDGKIITPHFYKNYIEKVNDLNLNTSTIKYIKQSMKDAVYKNSLSSNLAEREELLGELCMILEVKYHGLWKEIEMRI